MAAGPGALAPGLRQPLPRPGLIAALVIAGVIAAALAGLLTASGSMALDQGQRAYIGRIALFTLLQAALSTSVSLALGVMLARALARRPAFPGRTLLIGALGAASALPAILIVFALVTLYGRSSPVHAAARAAGLDTRSILYGLSGIVIAHCLLNAPMAARILLHGLQRSPGEHWRLAANLGMTSRGIFRCIEWPVLRAELPPLAALIFLLCATSFAIPLTLGGGPGAATLEVAIYEAVRFEADFARAGLLALLQTAGAGALIISAARLLTAAAASPPPRGIVVIRPDAARPMARLADGAVLAAGAGLVLPPALSLMAGLRGIAGAWDAALIQAALTSLGIALCCGLAASLLAVAIALSARAAASGTFAGAALSGITLLPLAMPPFALAAGLYILLRGRVEPGHLALPLTILVNAMMALPFAYRLVAPPLAAAELRYGRLAASLGISAMARFRLADWPLLKRPLAACFATAAALSVGDLGVFALFASADLATLPYLLYQHLGAYRLAEAEAVAGCLLILFMGLFLIAGLAHAQD